MTRGRGSKPQDCTLLDRRGAFAFNAANFEESFGAIKLSPKPKSHGGRRLGAGAPTGEKNGNFKDGRYSCALTPEERRAAWKAHWQRKRQEWAEKRAQELRR
jgi:hypothetical protein